jgi:hypothetical protein
MHIVFQVVPFPQPQCTILLLFQEMQTDILLTRFSLSTLMNKASHLHYHCGFKFYHHCVQLTSEDVSVRLVMYELAVTLLQN